MWTRVVFPCTLLLAAACGRGPEVTVLSLADRAAVFRPSLDRLFGRHLRWRIARRFEDLREQAERAAEDPARAIVTLGSVERVAYRQALERLGLGSPGLVSLDLPAWPAWNRLHPLLRRCSCGLAHADPPWAEIAHMLSSLDPEPRRIGVLVWARATEAERATAEEVAEVFRRGGGGLQEAGRTAHEREVTVVPVRPADPFETTIRGLEKKNLDFVLFPPDPKFERLRRLLEERGGVSFGFAAPFWEDGRTGVRILFGARFEVAVGRLAGLIRSVLEGREPARLPVFDLPAAVALAKLARVRARTQPARGGRAPAAASRSARPGGGR